MIKKNKFLKVCKEVRFNTLNSIFKAGSGHSGPSLSIVELLVFIFFNIKKKNEKFVLSKGHGVPSLYATFSALGLISKKELNKLRMLNSRLQGHPDMTKLKFLDAGTGALGQGLSIAIGYALSFTLKKKNLNSYCILGDGEIQEGQIWEAAMYAGTKKVSNLCAILDNNKFQNETLTKKTMNIYPIKEKFKSFNWRVLEIDGHDFDEIKIAFNKFFKEKNKPILIIANTTKGKGISFMENNEKWHAKKITIEDFKKIEDELK
jgi:transketolase